MTKIKNKKKTSGILSFTASICFFITFLMTKTTLNLIFSIVWLIIGITYFTEYKKCCQNKENNIK